MHGFVYANLDVRSLIEHKPMTNRDIASSRVIAAIT